MVEKYFAIFLFKSETFEWSKDNFAIYIFRTVVSFWHEILSNAPRFTIYKFSSLERDFFFKKK